jgi:hypothetical protein
MPALQYRIAILLAIALPIALAPIDVGASEAIPVEIRSQGDDYALFRGGEPYFVKGVGGQDKLELLAAAGGNSIRTWGASQIRPLLDRAHALNLSVTVGLWVGHERHGFDYGDSVAVATQLEKFRQTVRELKDHPALLMWGIGNEVHLSYSDRRVWDAIDAIAAMISHEDGQHPTMTVLAGANPEAVAQVLERCPHLDALGVNSYAGLPSLAKRLRQLGWTKPYLVTEWGTNGFWEVAKTPWEAPIEPTSTEKAALIRQRYTDAIIAETGFCLGSYAFLWGHKQERTPTWFGFFLASGEATAQVEGLRQAWGGPAPTNRAPSVSLPSIADAPDSRLQSGQTYTASSIATDPDGDTLVCRWEIWPESQAASQGGDAEEAPKKLKSQALSAGVPFVFQAPPHVGAYRLYLYVLDGEGHAATTNLPFYVEAASH